MTEKNIEQKKVLQVYAAMTASLVVSFVPSTIFAVFALVLFTGSFIAAYAVRKKAEENSLTENHMTYLIRTIWIVSLLAAITVVIGSVYVLSVYDPTPIHVCVDRLMNGGGMDYATINAMIQPCMDNFMQVNKKAFLLGGAMTIVPVILYLVYRLSKGLSRANKGYRIADVKKWI